MVYWPSRFTSPTIDIGIHDGIFPWYLRATHSLVFADPRYVLEPEHFHVGRSLKKQLKKTDFTVTLYTAFDDVIDTCAKEKADAVWYVDNSGYATRLLRFLIWAMHIP